MRELGGDKSIGEANLRKGHSPFNGRRTLRPNLSCGRFVYCGNGVGIEVLAKPIFVRGVSPFNGSGTAAPFNGSGTAAPVPFRVAFGGEIFLNIGEFYFTAKYGRQYLQFYHRFVL